MGRKPTEAKRKDVRRVMVGAERARPRRPPWVSRRGPAAAEIARRDQTDQVEGGRVGRARRGRGESREEEIPDLQRGWQRCNLGGGRRRELREPRLVIIMHSGHNLPIRRRQVGESRNVT